MCEPLIRGNMIVLKGDKLASGKDLVIESTIKQFLRENDNQRVIHVGLSAPRADHLLRLCGEELTKD